MLTVRRASLAEILSLRHRELRPGLPLDAARFEGDDEDATRHFGAFFADDAEPVGCASFMLRPWQGAPAWQLRGMATRADLARRGIGTALLRFAESELHTAATTLLLWCNARIGAVAFYTLVGWTVVSEPFDIPGVGPHRTMLRHLA